MRVIIGISAAIIAGSTLANAAHSQLLGSGTTQQAQAVAQALPGPLQADLTAALTSGDVKAVDAIVAANAGNPAIQAQIASQILAAAQSAKGSNPTLAGMYAAVAVASGALVGASAVTALNMVVSNPGTMALLTNPNAPAFTSNFFASVAVPNRPIGVANSGVIAAENSAQTSGSNN